MKYTIVVHVFTKATTHFSCLFVVCAILCNSQHINNNNNRAMKTITLWFRYRISSFYGPTNNKHLQFMLYIYRCFCPLAQGYNNNSAYLNFMSLISHPVSYLSSQLLYLSLSQKYLY